MGRLPGVLVRSWAPIAFFIASCAEPAPEPGPIGAVADGCLVVEMPRKNLRLPDVDLRHDGSPTVRTSLLLTNPCEGELRVDGAEIESPQLTVEGPTTGTIPAGENRIIDVVWSPTSVDEVDTVLWVHTSDPVRPATRVRVRGQPIGPRIAFVHDVVDIGSPPVGCVGSGTVEVRNTGNVPLKITGVELLGPDADGFSAQTDLPVTLEPFAEAPDSVLDVVVSHPTLDAAPESIRLAFTSGDPIDPVSMATVRAAGTHNLVTDTQGALRAAHADFLYVVDRDTRDFVAWEPALIRSVDDVRQSFERRGMDYRIAVSVQDSGCVAGPDLFIDESFSASQAEASMRTMLDRHFELATHGSLTERGLARAANAIGNDATEPGGCHTYLFRPEASLGMVFLSDEPDQSPRDWKHYTDEIETAKGEPGRVVLNAIIGPPAGGCVHAAAGLGYSDATRATGGVIANLCTFGSADVALMADAVPNPRALAILTAEAVPHTIEVSIDGGRVEGGWSYMAAPSPRVVFDDDTLPTPEQPLEIRYDRVVDCPGE